MLQLIRDGSVPMYEQMYLYIRDEIESGRIEAGKRLLSVRRMAELYGVSKITVEQAYVQLAAEGYIDAHNRAPYEVLPLRITVVGGKLDTEHLKREKRHPITTPIRFDFSSATMDPEGFDFSRWQRVLNYVLRRSEHLLSYGRENGEEELRYEIASYIIESRGARVEPEQIVIGSGTQALLQISRSLLNGPETTIHPLKVAVVGDMFYGGRTVFESAGDTWVSVGTYSGGIPEEENTLSLSSMEADVLYCTPSHANQDGGILSIGQRLEILEWANTGNRYVIEDDYDSELRYMGRPVPALQGLDRQGRVVYVGTVSKVLPPSIRLSYMVLPPSLLELYSKNMAKYRQTAGKLEQLALAEYIRRGEWARQIRRLRKHYQEKSQQAVSLLRRYFGNTIDVTHPEGGVYLYVIVHTLLTEQALVAMAREGGCAVKEGGSMAEDPAILLSFSAVRTTDLENAVIALKKAWKGI